MIELMLVIAGFLIGYMVGKSRMEYVCLIQKDRGDYWHQKYVQVIKEYDQR